MSVLAGNFIAASFLYLIDKNYWNNISLHPIGFNASSSSGMCHLRLPCQTRSYQFMMVIIISQQIFFTSIRYLQMESCLKETDGVPQGSSLGSFHFRKGLDRLSTVKTKRYCGTKWNFIKKTSFFVDSRIRFKANIFLNGNINCLFLFLVVFKFLIQHFHYLFWTYLLWILNKKLEEIVFSMYFNFNIYYFITYFRTIFFYRIMSRIIKIG